MGTCRHCNTEITMEEGDVICPNCGLKAYKCWHCGKTIPENLKQCPKCGFYKCPECLSCGPDCELIDEIHKTIDLNPSFKKHEKAVVRIITAYVRYLSNRKHKPRYCQLRNVTHTRAKETIKIMKIMKKRAFMVVSYQKIDFY